MLNLNLVTCFNRHPLQEEEAPVDGQENPPSAYSRGEFKEPAVEPPAVAGAPPRRDKQF